MKDKRIYLLKEAPIYKAINEMSIPAIVGLLVLAIYNVADTMFVAWIGTAEVGATQVVLPLMILASAIGLTFGIGGGSYLSRLLGKGNMEDAHEVASTAFFTSLIIGVIYSVVSIILIEPILRFFGASESLMSLSKTYGVYILIGSMFTMGNMAMNNLLRSEGSGKLSMIGLAAGSIINIILDPIFIFVFDMGIAGAAIATIISQMISFLILYSRYTNNHTIAKIKLKYFKPSFLIYKEIFRIGVSTFFRQLLFSMAIAVLNKGAVLYGEESLLAAVGIIFKIGMLPMYIIFGLGQGFQPVAGYNFGAKNEKRVMESLKYAMKITCAVGIVGSIILIVFAPQLVQLFRANEEVAAYGVRGLRFSAVGLVFMAATNTAGTFYQALGKGKQALLIAVARQGVFYIPTMLFLPKLMGADGILITQLIADLLTTALAGAMFIPFILNQPYVETKKSY